MKTDDFIQVAAVNRWQSTDEHNLNWETSRCVMALENIWMVQRARILRQLGGAFPEPHGVIAIIGKDWSVLVEPDVLCRDFLLEWLELTQYVEPERLVTFLMDD